MKRKINYGLISLIVFTVVSCSPEPATLIEAPEVALELQRYSAINIRKDKPEDKEKSKDKGKSEDESEVQDAFDLAPHMTMSDAQFEKYKTELRTQSGQDPILLTNYAPWFQTPDISGYWSKHWTMNNCDPDIIDPITQEREICSHYYPLIGPYDTADPDLLEYHILLMKLSGIDGIIIDFFGIQPFYDWPELKTATDTVMNAFNDAGMKVAIMYTERTIKIAMDNGLITDPIAAAQADIEYIEDNYFGLANYVKLDGEPLLMNYGPSYFSNSSEWQSIHQNLTSDPPFASLGYIANFSDTTFPWIEWPHWQDYIPRYYAYANWRNFDYKIGSAYFGFHDYYAEGGWGNNLYELTDPDGLRFSNYLTENNQHSPDIIQLNTWNGFSEGTMLEPTKEFGYKYLTELQAFTGVSFDLDDLELATEVYAIRKRLEGSTIVTEAIPSIVSALHQGNTSHAALIMHSLQEEGK